MTDSEPLDLDKLRVLACRAYDRAEFNGRGVLLVELGQALLAACSEIVYLRAENAAHVQDMALLAEALDPLRAMTESES